MVTRKQPKSPPSAEARADLLRVIGTTAAPQPAAALAKLLVDPYKIPPAQLGPLLDEFVAAGTLFRLPAATAKGKPRYWDRDLASLVRGRVAALVGQAAAPLTAKEVAGQIADLGKLTEADIVPHLTELVATQQVYELPPAGSGKTPRPRYWNRDVGEWNRRELLRILETKGPQKRAALKKGAKSLDEGQFEAALAELQRRGVLFHHPPTGKSGESLLAHRPVSPLPYLKEIEKSLGAIVAKLQGAQVPEEEIRRAVVQTVEAAGVRFGGGGQPGALRGSEPEGTRTGAAATAAPASVVDLIGLMKQIEPGAARGALVRVADLRRVAGLNKIDFDRSVMDLSGSGRLALHRHDFPSTLSPEQRDLLITDGAGNYFAAMALRQIDG